MKNIHILPTPNPSCLVLETVNNNLFLTTTKSFPTNIMKFQNIYITSDEGIKEGDWVLFISTNEVIKVPLGGFKGNVYKKIILTTDPDLIKDGIQAIDDEFLEWFVKNPSCEEVEVQKFYGFAEDYLIIIPKEDEEDEAYLNKLIDEANKEFTLDRKLAKEVAIKFSKWQAEKDKKEIQDLKRQTCHYKRY